MTKSIIPNGDKKRCFFCRYTRDLETHHVWHGTANRKLSEEDGLKVFLCWSHHQGIWGIHTGNVQYDIALRKIAEVAWLKKNGKTVEDFIKRYGGNVLEHDEVALVESGELTPEGMIHKCISEGVRITL